MPPPPNHWPEPQTPGVAEALYVVKTLCICLPKARSLAIALIYRMECDPFPRPYVSIIRRFGAVEMEWWSEANDRWLSVMCMSNGRIQVTYLDRDKSLLRMYGRDGRPLHEALGLVRMLLDRVMGREETEGS